MEKQELSKDQVEILEQMTAQHTKQELITHYAQMTKSVIHNNFTFNELFNALAYGYEEVKTPHEQVAEYYNKYTHRGYSDKYASGVLDGVRKTLNTLGITVKGVND